MHQHSRRAALALATAAAATPTVAAAAPTLAAATVAAPTLAEAAESNPHLAWLGEAVELRRRAFDPGLDNDVPVDLLMRAEALDDLILTTAADTLTDLACQLVTM